MMGKSFQKPPQNRTGFGELRGVIAELFLHSYRILNTEKVYKVVLTNHLTLSPALFEVLDSQKKERLAVE